LDGSVQMRLTPAMHNISDPQPPINHCYEFEGSSFSVTPLLYIWLRIKKGNKTFADITVLTKITTIDNQPNLWLLERKFPERYV